MMKRMLGRFAAARTASAETTSATPAANRRIETVIRRGNEACVMIRPFTHKAPVETTEPSPAFADLRTVKFVNDGEVTHVPSATSSKKSRPVARFTRL